MKLLTCPLNGPRNITEFTYGGEYHPMPDHQQASSREWAEHVFFHDNAAGVVIEWWCHSASSYWFLAERNTISDKILRTFPASEIFNQRIDFNPLPEPTPTATSTPPPTAPSTPPPTATQKGES